MSPAPKKGEPCGGYLAHPRYAAGPNTFVLAKYELCSRHSRRDIASEKHASILRAFTRIN